MFVMRAVAPAMRGEKKLIFDVFMMKSDKNDESAENFLASSSSFLQKTNSQHNKRNTNSSFFCLK